MKIIPFFVSMNVGLFFDPIDESILPSENKLHCFANHIHINQGGEPDWTAFDVCIFSIAEYRGQNTEVKKADEAMIALRSYLYRLAKGKGSYKILDLGCLRPGESLDDSRERVQEVCELLMAEKVFPIVIGGSHDLDLGQFNAYANLNKLINVLTIDSNIDIEEADLEASSHTKKILMDERAFLSSYTHVGQQNFLVNKAALDVFSKLNITTFRLGELHDNTEQVEPDMRSADMVSFDLSVLKFPEAGATFHQHPFGLDALQACQLAWYAGMSNQVSSIGFYGLNPDFDDHQQTVKILATIIWHFVDGYYNDTESLYFEGGEYMKYIVPLEQAPNEIVFYKGNLTGKWWMSLLPDGSELAAHDVIPCDDQDYLEALQGEIPDRYLQHI